MKYLLSESLIHYMCETDSRCDGSFEYRLMMIDGGAGEGMPDQFPEIPYKLVKLKLCII